MLELRGPLPRPGQLRHPRPQAAGRPEFRDRDELVVGRGEPELQQLHASSTRTPPSSSARRYAAPTASAVPQLRRVTGARFVRGGAVDDQRPYPETGCQRNDLGDRDVEISCRRSRLRRTAARPIGSAPREHPGSGRTSRAPEELGQRRAACRSVTSPAALTARSGPSPRRRRPAPPARSAGAVPFPPTVTHSDVAPFSRSARADVAATAGSGSVSSERMSQPVSTPRRARQPADAGEGWPTVGRQSRGSSQRRNHQTLDRGAGQARPRRPRAAASSANLPARRSTAAAATSQSCAVTTVPPASRTGPSPSSLSIVGS